MNPKIKTALKIFSNTLVIITVLLTFLLYGFQIFGVKTYTVMSGSMESVYPTGSLVYVAKIDPAKLDVNDVITYKKSSGTLVTHRIIEFVTDETNPDIIRFKTKGDENSDPDGTLVEYDSVIGKVLFCIPQLGRFARYISYPPGKYVALTVAISVILIEIIISIILDDKDKKKTNSEQN